MLTDSDSEQSNLNTYLPNAKNSLDRDATMIFFPVKDKSRCVAYFKSARIREYIFVHHMG